MWVRYVEDDPAPEVTATTSGALADGNARNANDAMGIGTARPAR
jgi:hypothetical protein